MILCREAVIYSARDTPSLPFIRISQSLPCSVAHVRHADIYQPMGFNQTHNPDKSSTHVHWQRVEFILNRLIRNQYSPAHAMSAIVIPYMV